MFEALKTMNDFRAKVKTRKSLLLQRLLKESLSIKKIKLLNASTRYHPKYQLPKFQLNFAKLLLKSSDTFVSSSKQGWVTQRPIYTYII